ncbi:MAG: PilZ domain-containing protein [Phycisphaerales bacterium]|nr:PilZ domain-containing protein [Phycisphaerales bacterium]
MINANDNSILNNSDADSLIDELAQSSSEAVKKMRGHARRSVRVKVFVEPASMSARTGVRFQGVTGDISSGGTQILLARPLAIGDVYLISFERTELDIPPVYALCLRGRTVRPDAYEAGLRFLEPVTLPNDGSSDDDGGLI